MLKHNIKEHISIVNILAHLVQNFMALIKVAR